MTNDVPLDDIIGDLRESIERDVAAGFLSPEDVVESAIDYLSDEVDPERLRPAAERLTASALAAHAEAEKTWPAVTDCDRLDRAFAGLEADGIVARHDFSCCGSCGAAEILDVMENVAAGGRPVRGYTFYHAQDTEGAVDGYGLYLNYGTADDDEAAAVAVARDVVAALEHQGLAPRWDGSWSTRIFVPLDWKRRRA